MMRLSLAALVRPFRPWGAASRRGRDTSGSAVSMLASAMEFVLIAMLLAWPLCTSLAFALSASAVDAQFDRGLRAAGDSVAGWLERQRLPWGDGAPFALRDIYTDHGSLPERRLSVLDMRSGESLVTDHRLMPAAARLRCSTGAATLENIELESGPARSLCLYTSLARGGPTEPSLIEVRVWLTEPLHDRDASLRETFLVAAVPVALASLLFVLIAYLGVRKGLRPLHALQRALRDRVGQAVPLESDAMPGELAALAHVFNRLVSRVDARLQSEKRFISNAAHQMRAPLAGLQAEAELALKSQDGDAARRHLLLIGDRVESMGRLVNQLMSLARLDDRDRLRAGFDTFDLRAVCEAALVRHAAAARTKAMDLGFDCGHKALGLIGNAVLIEEMLSNLIDNAIKYTSAGGEVTLALHVIEPSGHVELVVSDDGPGLAPEEAQHAFERFARIHPEAAGGCGLGLAIVQQVASLHGATLEVQSPARADTAVGTSFIVSLDARDRRDLPAKAAT
jgi:two-component system sensor histidine kinase TctE